TGSWRLPGTLGDNQLDRLETLLLLCIIPITHTDKTVTVLGEELPGTFLARFEVQKNAHIHLTNSLTAAQGQMRAEQDSLGWPARAGIPLRVRPSYAPSHA